MFVSLPKVLVIEDVTLPVELERLKRKTLAIQVTRDIHLLIKAPWGMSEREISRFVEQKQFWLYKQAKRMMECKTKHVERSKEEIRILREQAREILTEKTNVYVQQLGVSYNKIRIGNQTTRWGSCSSKGTISYNWKLVLMPEAIMDYVVVHEVCHLKEMNHSSQFWQLVSRVLPDYEQRRAWLKQHGNEYE